MSGPRVTVVSSPLAPLKNPEPPPPPPAPFKIDSSTQLEDWKKWQISFKQYALVTNLDQMSHEVQLSAFKSIVGPDAVKIYNTFSSIEITDLESVLRKFNEHFEHKTNVTLERYKLYKMHQKPGQKFDDYLADITNQVDKCGFDSMRDDIVLYKIVGGISNDKIRTALLADSDLKFHKAVQICRASSAEHFMSGRENSRKRKTEEFEAEGAGKNPEAGSATKMQKMQVQNATGSKGMGAVGRSGRRDASAGATGHSKEEYKGSSDGGDDDFRGVDGHYVIEIDSDDDDPLESTGDTEWEENETKGQELVADSKDSKWAKKEHSRKKLHSALEKHLACDMCDKTFRMEISLEMHRKTHLPSEPTDLTCYYCERVFRKRTLRKHMKVLHSDILGLPGPKIYACGVCHFTTRFSANFARHQFQHTGHKPLSCEYCDYKCITRRLMKAHLAKLHTLERAYTCSVCNRGFLHSDAMKRHMVVHQPKTERPKKRTPANPVDCTCDACGKVFASKASLQVHLLRHTGEKTFACHYCDFRTVSSGGLSSHIYFKHTDERPFVCTICGFSCKQRQGLTRHMMQHRDEKPHACEICGRRFLQTSHVKRHMAVHTGEKPHVCEICGHRWAQRDNLRAHMKVHLKQSGDPSQNVRRRERQKKLMTVTVSGESDESDYEVALAEGVIQWSEEVEFSTNVESPPPADQTFSVHQGDPKPAGSRDSVSSGNVRTSMTITYR